MRFKFPCFSSNITLHHHDFHASVTALIIGAVILALGVQKTLPVICFVGLPGICIDFNCNAITDIESCNHCRSTHESTDGSSDEGGECAPLRNISCECVELASILRFDHQIALYVTTLAQ